MALANSLRRNSAIIGEFLGHGRQPVRVGDVTHLGFLTSLLVAGPRLLLACRTLLVGGGNFLKPLQKRRVGRLMHRALLWCQIIAVQVLDQLVQLDAIVRIVGRVDHRQDVPAVG